MTTAKRCSPEILAAGASIAASKLAAAEREAPIPASFDPDDATDLFDGPWGPALLWGALAASRPEKRDEYSERCEAYLQPLSTSLSNLHEMETLGVGGLSGLGAPVYALAALGSILAQDELIDQAETAAAWITETHIAQDRQYDVVAGCAGALLALLAVDELLAQRGLDAASDRRSQLLSKAKMCGQHLLETEIRDGDLSSWATPSGQRQTGFAHGAAGIRHALLRLYAKTRDEPLLIAARGAAAFEAAHYLPQERAWLPFPEFDPRGPLMTAWCWGGPGIALSFAVDPGGQMTPVFKDLLESGLESTRRRKATHDDYPCCGNLGRAWILKDVANWASEEDRSRLISEGDRIVYGVLGRLKSRGDFGWRPAEEGAPPTPTSFFKGVSGVGYAFLALAHKLPMVLRLAVPAD